MGESNKVFMRITNKDIYDRLGSLEKKNDEAHLDILLHQKQTNGKIKLNRWIATTALSTVLAVVIAFVTLKLECIF